MSTCNCHDSNPDRADCEIHGDNQDFVAKPPAESTDAKLARMIEEQKNFVGVWSLDPDSAGFSLKDKRTRDERLSLLLLVQTTGKALENTLKCFDAARFEGAFSSEVPTEIREEVIGRRLLCDVEDVNNFALLAKDETIRELK